MSLRGRVGIAPGTTTMMLHGLGSPWNPDAPDPSERYMPPGAFIVGGDAMVPHDFELAKIYGYTPYMQGWTVGTVSRRGDGLGETAEEELRTQLELKRLSEEIKTTRQTRVWAAVGAMAAVGGLVVSIVALRRR